MFLYSVGIFSLSLVCLWDTHVHLLIPHSVSPTVKELTRWTPKNATNQGYFFIFWLASLLYPFIFLWYSFPPVDTPIPSFSRLNPCQIPDSLLTWTKCLYAALHPLLGLWTHPSIRTSVSLKDLVACWMTEPHSRRGTLPKSASVRRESSTLGAVPSRVAGLHSWGPLYLEPKSLCSITPMFTLCGEGW